MQSKYVSRIIAAGDVKDLIKDTSIIAEIDPVGKIICSDSATFPNVEKHGRSLFDKYQRNTAN